MIELVHMIVGGTIGSVVSNPLLAIFLALLSHYLLDIMPHIEYTKIVGRVRRLDIAKASIDFLVGAILVVFFTKNQPIVYVCVFFSILPDIIFLSKFLINNKVITAHEKFHDRIHFLEHEKISNFWRVSTQVLIVVISLLVLRA
jgi:hypothetical protein